jgi:hypothetical protein
MDELAPSVKVALVTQGPFGRRKSLWSALPHAPPQTNGQHWFVLGRRRRRHRDIRLCSQGARAAWRRQFCGAARGVGRSGSDGRTVIAAKLTPEGKSPSAKTVAVPMLCTPSKRIPNARAQKSASLPSPSPRDMARRPAAIRRCGAHPIQKRQRLHPCRRLQAPQRKRSDALPFLRPNWHMRPMRTYRTQLRARIF